jgi:glycosyltransferase involved in cell wall biosynthesis
MRIAYITAGAADMYCGSCIHDNTLAAALNARGHECLLVPTYTPIRTDETDVSEHRVFFGGVSIYLAQKSRLFRHMPGFLDRLLSRPGLLRWVSRRFGLKTRPEDLGDLTLSMLRGEHGNQRQELAMLISWLQEQARPEIVCLTNALLSGIVPELKRRLGVPVVVTLQGDDIYLDWLSHQYREQAIALIRENCKNVDSYLVTCRYYADFMAGYLGLPREKMHVVYPGIRIEGYERTDAKVDPCGKNLIIGYLARICPEKGLHILVEACQLLHQMPGLPPWRLRAAGYLAERDRTYLQRMDKYGKVGCSVEHGEWPLKYHGELNHAGKIAFLQSVDVLSVPTTYREPKGLYVLEAWAAGVPVVQPRHGSFPELIEMTGGGVLVEPENPAALAEGLRELLLDETRRRELGEKGRRGVQEYFTAEVMAESTLAVFERCLKRVSL